MKVSPIALTLAAVAAPTALAFGPVPARRAVTSRSSALFDAAFNSVDTNAKSTVQPVIMVDEETANTIQRPYVLREPASVDQMDVDDEAFFDNLPRGVRLG
jgi:hypothetical protein